MALSFVTIHPALKYDNQISGTCRADAGAHSRPVPLPSDMDDEREKHLVCHKCVKQKLPTTYWCGIDCPANPGAWKLHGAYHKEEKRQRNTGEDGGVAQQRDRELAEEQARRAAQTGDPYRKLIAEGHWHDSKQDWRRAARVYRKAIALRPEEPVAFMNLGGALDDSGHKVEAAQRYLEAKERYPVGSKDWAVATAKAFHKLWQEECSKVAKPEWWNDSDLKALSARVVRIAPTDEGVHHMRAMVLRGRGGGLWGAGPRSAAELKKAATHYERAAALCDAPVGKDMLTYDAAECRNQVDAM